jgi:chromosome segregation ATPase
MKNILLSLLAIPVLLMTIAACSSNDDKTSAEDVNDAKENLKDAAEDYKEEVENYRNDMQQTIYKNRDLITELKAEKASADKKVNEERKSQIAKLEEQNDDLEVRINEYTSENEANWKAFKKEFSHDMSEIGKAFKDLGVDNSK